MRKPQQNKTKPVYAVVGDGECERWYIQMLTRNERALTVRLKPELQQKKKLKEQFSKVLELARDHTHVFWLVDYDVILSESRQAPKGKKPAAQEFKEYYTKLEKKKNVTVIINNPCLEYWILLHYEDAAGNRYNNCDAVTNHLHKHCPDYEKTLDYFTRQNNDIYLKLKAQKKAAIDRANKCHEGFDIEDFNADIALSQMHLLFQQLF